MENKYIFKCLKPYYAFPNKVRNQIILKCKHAVKMFMHKRYMASNVHPLLEKYLQLTPNVRMHDQINIYNN